MTKHRFLRWLTVCTAVLALALALHSGPAQAAGQAGPNLKNYKQTLAYVKEQHPLILDLDGVTFEPTQLLALQNAMPSGGVLHFTTTWLNCTFSDSDRVIDLRKIKKTPAKAELEALIKLCPACRMINIDCKRCPANKIMMPLVDQNPQIEFGWRVHLGAEYYCSSLATTFSTFIGSKNDGRLSSKDLEALKYCPHLKALDLGHNNIYSISFLQYVPELEMLILACNHITDTSPLAQLKHLQYLELFTNKTNDISPLAQCTELLDLNIANTRITDLKALDDLPKLERLWAKYLKYLDKGELQRYVADHPNVIVGYAEADVSWRDHDRYFHYRWCLKHNQWIPFDEPLPNDTQSLVPRWQGRAEQAFQG